MIEDTSSRECLSKKDEPMIRDYSNSSRPRGDASARKTCALRHHAERIKHGAGCWPSCPAARKLIENEPPLEAYFQLNETSLCLRTLRKVFAKSRVASGIDRSCESFFGARVVGQRKKKEFTRLTHRKRGLSPPRRRKLHPSFTAVANSSLLSSS